MKVGNKVVKNPDTWIPNDFDSWGRGEGIGEVVESPFKLDKDQVDVRWKGGRCFENVNQLIKVDEENLQEMQNFAANLIQINVNLDADVVNMIDDYFDELF